MFDLPDSKDHLPDFSAVTSRVSQYIFHDLTRKGKPTVYLPDRAPDFSKHLPDSDFHLPDSDFYLPDSDFYLPDSDFYLPRGKWASGWFVWA